jgi:uncharacterized protein
MKYAFETTLITGASGGIGAVYADRLARRGSDLILVARNHERLEAVAARITRETGRNVEVVTADLADPRDLARVEEILRVRPGINALVNNAGFGGPGLLLDSDVDKMSEMIAVNVTALTRLTYAAVPRFVERGRGLVVNIASIVAIEPELLNGVYGATKAYVVGFTRSLQHELADKGIRVQAVLPGAIATEFWSAATLEYLPKEIVMSTEDLVDASLAGLDLGEVFTIPSLPDANDWAAYEAARDVLRPNLSRAKPALRYGAARSSAA